MSDSRYYSNKETLQFILSQFEKLKNHGGFKAQHKNYPDTELNGFFIEDIYALMCSELTLNNPSVEKFERLAIIKESIFKYVTEHDGTTDIDAFLKVVQRLESESLKKENKKFVFYSSLSAVPFSLVNKGFQNLWGTFRVLKNWPRRIKQSKDWMYAVATAGSAPPDSFPIIKIVTTAKNLHDAADKAWKTVDCERGFWNLDLNFNRERLFSIQDQPFNKIYLGGIHFAEFDNKRNYFIGPSYVKNFTDPDLSKFRDSFYEKSKERFSKHFDQNFLGEALIKYSNALDLPDKNFALTKLWELLEYLSCLENEDNNVLIKRVSKLFEDEQNIWMILDHVRKARNEYIHSSNDINPHSQKTLFLLKKIVEMTFLFHFEHGGKFSDIKEYKHYLDLPNYASLDKERGNLKAKIALIDLKQGIPQMTTSFVWRK